MRGELAQRLNERVIPWVTIWVPLPKAEQGVHSCCSSGVAFSPVVTHEPNFVWQAVKVLRDCCVALGAFFRACMRIKPVTEKFLKVTRRAVPVKQFLSLNAAL